MESLFAIKTPVWEIILRASVIYLGLFCLLRFVMKRESGAIGIPDLLVVVIIANAAENGLEDDSHSLTHGLIMAATVVFWTSFLDWIAFKFPRIAPLIHPREIPLIQNGRILYKNLEKELLTEAELMGQLRQQGIEDLAQVKKAFLEGEGRISIISTKKKARPRKRTFQ